MNTCFAPSEKTDPEELAAEIEAASRSPVISGLLRSIGGLLAILNEHRQVIALNDSLLELLGNPDSSMILGLRLGEVLGCIHAHEGPGHTCGSTRFCSSCGAAIAIVTSLGQDGPDERMCALSAHRGDQPMDMALRIRCHPIRIDERRFLLVFLQDVTRQQQRAALERTFFHDINNLLGMLSGASERLVETHPSEPADLVRDATARLIKEVAIQQCLSSSDEEACRPQWTTCRLERILKDLRSFFANHPVAKGKTIEFPADIPPGSIRTDFLLISRVLCNMVLNALEATEPGGCVRVDLVREERAVIFTVWNRKAIPPEIASRIFQRNFSTKEDAGRGIGTFSMKLFGEKMLRGLVDFSSTEAEGTTFRFTLPA